MKQAETCCGDGVPTLNQTGELNEKYWCTQQPGQLVLEDLGVGSASAK